MVTPVTSKESSKKVYLPKGEWYDLFTNELMTGEKEIQKETPIYQIPVFVKASSIIPMQSLVQSAKEKPADTLFIHIYNGRENNQYVYYEDAGDGFEYKQGVYCKKIIDFNPSEKKIILGKQEGSFTSKFTQLKFIFHGFGNELLQVTYGDKNLQVINEFGNRPLNPLENLTEIYDPAYYNGLKELMGDLKTKTLTIKNSTVLQVLQW